MAITEIIFPALKTDKPSIEGFDQDWPAISKIMLNPNPGILSAFRGWVLEENGQDVRETARRILIFEWRDESAFHAFGGSDQYVAFTGSLKRWMTAPPTLQLYDTKASPKHASAAPVLEIIRLGVSSSESTKAAGQAWEKLVQASGEQNRTKPIVTYGGSLNLEKKTIAGMLGWASFEERSAASNEDAFAETLASLKSLGEISRLVVDVSQMDMSET